MASGKCTADVVTDNVDVDSTMLDSTTDIVLNCMDVLLAKIYVKTFLW